LRQHTSVIDARYNVQLEETSTHKSAKSHADNVFMTRNLDLWSESKLGFQDSLWNISMSSLVILAASVSDIWCVKIDRQTNGDKTLQLDCVGIYGQYSFVSFMNAGLDELCRRRYSMNPTSQWNIHGSSILTVKFIEFVNRHIWAFGKGELLKFCSFFSVFRIAQHSVILHITY